MRIISSSQRKKLSGKLPKILVCGSLIFSILSVAPSTKADILLNVPGCASTVADSSASKVSAAIDGEECVLTFYGNNTWTPPAGVISVKYLVIGGGGGGAGGRGGGGGGGGFVEGATSALESQTVVVGAGGLGGSVSGASKPGKSGGDSKFGSVIAYGGGGGQTSFGSDPQNYGYSGGSGGGAGIYSSAGTTDDGATGYRGGIQVAEQGYAGGGSGPGYSSLKKADNSYSTLNWDLVRNTGGGGGAGGPGKTGRGGTRGDGTNSNIPAQAPDGGIGKQSSITGTSTYYAGGGGGSAGRGAASSENIYYTAGAGSGGNGGGGAGGPVSGSVGGNGTDFLGGGGGAGSISGTSPYPELDGGKGGKGVVILRFHKMAFINQCGATIDYASSSYVSTAFLNGYCILTFTTGATRDSTKATNFFKLPAGVSSIEYLVVAGGGSGGDARAEGNESGGGGAGGFLTGTVAISGSDTITVVVGIGGSGGSGGNNGKDSYIRRGSTELVRTTGGGVGSTTSTNNCPRTITPGSGGSGGGFSFNCGTTPNAGGAGIAGQGNSGESFANPSGGVSGGGGGAGGQGGYRVNTQIRSHGGDGKISSITGIEKVYAGGGSGVNKNATGTDSTTSTAKYPEGGGAFLSSNPSTYVAVGGNSPGRCSADGLSPGTDGALDTGSGGGGADCVNTAGGSGADGVVVIKYQVPTNALQTNNLNMACKSEGGGTQNFAFTTTPFQSDAGVSEVSFPYAGETSIKHDWGGDVTTPGGGYGGPAGCGTNDYTLYVSGYVQAPDDNVSKTVFFKTRSDDGAVLVIDGKLLVNDKTDHGANSYITASQGGVDYGLVMAPKSWHYVQYFMHERGGGAYLELAWWYSGLATGDTPIPTSRVSKTVPRTAAATYTAPFYNETSTVRATVDTASAVTGGYNDSSTVMSLEGSFTFIDSGTVISGCSAVKSVNGYAKCDWQPGGIDTRTVTIIFTPDTSTSITSLQYKVFSTTLINLQIWVNKGIKPPSG